MIRRLLFFLILVASQVSLLAQGWTDLGSSTIFHLPGTHDVCPPNQYGGATGTYSYFNDLCNYVFESWGGAAADTKRNQLLIFGSGHQASMDNSIYSLQMSPTPVMTHLTWPGQVAQAQVDQTTDIPPQPVSSHSYEGLVYLPRSDKLFFAFGVNVGGSATRATWLADVSQTPPVWARQADAPASSGSSGMTCVIDPTQSDEVVLCATAGNASLYQFDATTNTWSTLNSGGMVMTIGGTSYPVDGSMVVDPVRRTVFFMGFDGYGQRVIAMPIGPGANYNTFTDYGSLTGLTSGCTGLISQSGIGLVYDPSISRIVGYPNTGNSVYIFDPGSMTCVAQTFTGGPTGSTNNNLHGVWGRFNYFPSLGKYVVCNNPTADCYTFTLNANPNNGLGHSTLTCIDVDGDGYGTGPGCTGPDADDNDASVHTADQGCTKYGGATCATGSALLAFMNHLGYNPTRVWLLSTSGSDVGCAPGTLSSLPSPCATWYPGIATASSSPTAGDMVLMRGGTYTNYTTISPPTGTSGNPFVIMAYPGELPYINNIGNGLEGVDTGGHNFIIVDGIKTFGGANDQCIGVGAGDITVRHTETSNCFLGGIAGFDGLSDLTIEYNVVHDICPSGSTVCSSNYQHNIYLGSRNNPSSNIAIRRNLFYNPNLSGYPAVQFNGRVTNLDVEQNIIYNSDQAASFLEGVSNSRFVSNILFNNDSGLTISNYDGDCYVGSASSGVCPYNQTGNLIANNTFYAGLDPADGSFTAGPSLNVGNGSTGCPTGWAALTAYGLGVTILDSNGRIQTVTTAGTSGSSAPTWASTGTTSDGSVVWTAGSTCTPHKVGNLGGNTYSNNVFVNNANGYRPVLVPLFLVGGNCSSLDSGDTTLSTSIFQNNIFWQGAYSSAAIIDTCPTGGGSYGGAYTGHSISDLNTGSLWSASSANNKNSNPLFISASPTYWNSPSSYNLNVTALSPAVGAGMASTTNPPFDLLGAGLSPTTPNMGAYQTTGGSATLPSVIVGGFVH